MVETIAQRFGMGARRFSYGFANYGTPLTRETIDTATSQAFSQWKSAATSIDFYRKDDQPKNDIVIRFLKSSDRVFGAEDTAAVTFEEGSSNDAQVVIAVKDGINFFGQKNWNSSFFANVITHEIGHALGLGHSTAHGAIMAPDVTLASATLSADDIANVQAMYPPLKNIITLADGDMVDNYQLALVSQGFITESYAKDIFLVKTANSATGRVEVHSLTAASGYANYRRQVATPIPLADANKYQFLIANNSDLFCIKTSGPGQVEVHSLTAGSNYQTWYKTAATPLAVGGKRFFLIAENDDLFVVSTAAPVRGA